MLIPVQSLFSNKVELFVKYQNLLCEYKYVPRLDYFVPLTVSELDGPIQIRYI